MKKRPSFKKLSFSILKSKRVLIPGILLCTLIVVPLLIYIVFEIVYLNRVYPNIYVGNVSFAGKSPVESRELLQKIVTERTQKEILLNSPAIGQTISVGSVSNYATYDVPATVSQLVSYGRKGSFTEQFKYKLRLFKTNYSVTPVYAYDKDRLDAAIVDAVRPFEKPVVNSDLIYSNGNLVLTKDQNGFVADRDSVMQSFETFLAFTKESSDFELEVKDTKPEISMQNAESALNKAKMALNRPLVLKVASLQGQLWTLDAPKIYSLMTLKKTNKAIDVVIEDYKVASYSAEIANIVNKEPIDAKFQIENGRATEFEPATPGTKLNVEELTKSIATAAFDPASSSEIEIPLSKSEPAISTERVNNYGIKELVGQGKSKFVGSIPGRLHNIDLAASKLNGVIIAPGEVFSMYKYVGEVEKSTGFQDAYIIKDGRTVPGTGGGLCQVSTTLFRAALNAGLPIKERHEHAYRVHYYEEDSPPGIDAAVYFPSWDMKFLNDTGNHLLLQTKIDLKKMTAEFNLYGIKDGRKVELSKPVILSQTPPPPELRQDDPTLPRGQVKQVDWSAWGAKVSFTRKVFDKDGNLMLDDVFKSNYRPWQAVFMVGTKDN
jgi:vancomycin resistance protein YoaR